MKKILLLSCIIIGLVIFVPKVNACVVSGGTIDSISPTEIVPGETEVTIYGSDFNDDIQDNKVEFDVYKYGTIISWSDTKIVVRAPSNLYTNRISVKGCCGWQCSSSNYYTYTIKPKISYLSVNSIMPKEELIITGNNFGSNQGKIYIDGQQVNITQWSLINAKVIIPDLDSGNVNVEVETLDGVKSEPVSLTIKPLCNSDIWSCGTWTTCSSNGSQTRLCDKTNDCVTVDTPSPTTVQSCTPPVPTCIQNTWNCGDWSSCSLGMQNRKCTKTFDCPNTQTAAPITDRYCEAPSMPQQSPPSASDEILNQDTIIKSTVKLLCPVDNYRASQGSGTVIDSTGTILTNKHVIAGTLGCLVGFIDGFNDEPYFGDRHIADIVRISPNQDVAVLKMRNPRNTRLSYVDTTKGSVNFSLGTKITTYGYPAKFGTKITYTSGDFSGTDGNYLKTTAILEYGNSGGGAYLKNGTFIGIPSAVVKGQLNAMGYLLSIDVIKAWLNDSIIASGNTSNNNYSRVSVLEDIDLNKLDSLELFIPDVDDKGNLSVSTKNQSPQNTIKQSPPSETQEGPTIIDSNNPNGETNLEQDSPTPLEQSEENKEKENSEQRKSIVANAVQEIANIAERNGEIGQEMKITIQLQTQNQEKIETGIQKIKSRSGFAKFFIGPNYSEIRNSEKILEQNREQIQKLNEIRTQIIDQGEQLQIIEQIQTLEEVDQQIETLLDEAQKGFSLLGWVFRLSNR